MFRASFSVFAPVGPTPHWWTKAEKEKWLKRKRELIDTNEGYAISLLEMACDSYIIDTEALLMEMISAGTAKEKVKEKVDTKQQLLEALKELKTEISEFNQKK